MKFKGLYSKLSALMLAATLLFSNVSAAAESAEDDLNSDTMWSEFVDPVDHSRVIYLPDNMRGLVLTPGVDFLLYEENSVSTALLELDEIFAYMTSIGLNTIILKTSTPERVYYNLDMNNTGETDYIQLASERAQRLFINVFLVFDINPVLMGAPSPQDAVNTLVSEAHRFTQKYPCDGIIVDDYYSSADSESFGEYMTNGSGIGYRNWLYDSTEYCFETAGSIIRMTDNAIPVGIMLSDVWANQSSTEDGSPTSDSTEAYYDGYADTRAYVEQGYIDFAILRCYGALTDPSLPFLETAQWWSELCSAVDIPLYLIHYNEKIGGGGTGWNAEDQLLKQLKEATEEVTAYAGSIFNSYSSLLQNPLNTTTTLKQYYADKINLNTLDNELVMNSPRELRFTTYEPVVDFAGSFDENFDVYFNGNKITLNEAGNFYFEESLDIGMNTFTIRHKSKTYTYQIERKIITIKSLGASIAEGTSLSVDGETSITIQAAAYKGSEVTATLNGQTIKLKQSAGGDDDPNTSYVTYSGKYKVPAGIVEVEQPLGTISVTASYMGYTRTLTGASVTVNAKPKPVETVIDHEMFDQNALGTGEVVGTIGAVRGRDESVTLVYLNNNNTHVFDAKTTGSDYSPSFGQLPAGTVDYYKADVGGFYTTESGKRFTAASVSLISGSGFGENSLFVKSSGTSGGDSYFRIRLDTRSGYNVEVAGMNYFTEWDSDYNVSGFGATHVYVTFDNITSVTKLPDFDANLVFDAGSWEQVVIDGVPKFRLVLRLRQPGVYAGNSAYYSNDGDLILTFPVLSSTLSGMNIVIDPGHGYGKESASTYDPGAIGHVIEADMNLAVAKLLTEKLNALGANAVRLKTEQEHILTRSRPIVARQYGCDLFISIHSNRVTGNDSARGTEVYYFTPFSQPLASAISSSVSAYFTKNVYSDGADKNRGAKHALFQVTYQQDFPSVLVEMGFVSNLEDAMALANETHQAGIADAIITGIKNYLSRSSISYSVDSSVSAPSTPQAETTEAPPVTVAPPATVSPPETQTPATTEAEATDFVDTAEEESFEDEIIDETDDFETEEDFDDFIE